MMVACDGMPGDRGLQAVTDVAEEFTHRPWCRNVECKWKDGVLLISAENDNDPKLFALMDEFSDAISACLAADFGYSIWFCNIFSSCALS
jgi:hypothetical protein